MSQGFFFFIGAFCFFMVLIGIGLTIWEFNRTVVDDRPGRHERDNQYLTRR